MLTSRFRCVLLALALAVPACAPSEEDLDASESDFTAAPDVSPTYVGRYGPLGGANGSGGDVRTVLLRKQKTYALTFADGSSETGTYAVAKLTGGDELRLTPSTGPGRRYKATLVDGLRARLTLKRSGKTSSLEREPLSCATVSCATGNRCEVEENDGIPGPVCKVAQWRESMSDGLWAVTFELQPEVNDSKLYCSINSAKKIHCMAGVTGSSPQIEAPIAADGTFRASVPQSSSEIRGRIEGSGDVVLDAFRAQTCVWSSIDTWTCIDSAEKPIGPPLRARATQLCPSTRTTNAGWTCRP